MTVEELGEWLKQKRDFVLLDVREPFEVQMASIAGARLIPLREIPSRLHEFPREADIAVLCHHGARGSTVAHYLRANGFEKAVNIEGGIDAYARRVDASVGLY